MLTDVPGIQVGHVTDREAATGCTVILCPPGTQGSGEARGGWPAVREETMLHPLHSSPHVDGVLLTGGSVFGLAAVEGVVRWLEERGHDGIHHFVPQVPAAVIYDLRVGSAKVRPRPEDGYAACNAAASDPHALGTVGAGTGATVGKWYQRRGVMKGGVGASSLTLADGVVVAALAVVNALGDVYDRDGTLLAGVRRVIPDAPPLMEYYARHPRYRYGVEPPATGTTLVAVATNARLTKTQCALLARLAHSGLPRAVNPVYMANDGDTVFTLATGEAEAALDPLGAVAAEVVADAIRSAVREASGLAGIPALRDLARP